MIEKRLYRVLFTTYEENKTSVTSCKKETWEGRNQPSCIRKEDGEVKVSMQRRDCYRSTAELDSSTPGRVGLPKLRFATKKRYELAIGCHSARDLKHRKMTF